MTRIIRDVLILVAFCGAFYMLTLFVGSEDKFSAERSNFSRDRLLADESFADQDWETAIKHLDQMLLDDPFNELAIARKSHADFELAEQRIASLVKRKSRVRDDQTAVEQIDSEITQIVSASIPVQQALLQSYRFRTAGLQNIVILNCLGKNKEAAIEALKQYAMEPEDVLRRPFTPDRRLVLLRGEPEFIRLNMRERRAFYHQ